MRGRRLHSASYTTHEVQAMGPTAQVLLMEIDAEARTTRRVLERVPAHRFEWQPHPKSMTAGQLAQHVASIPGSVARLSRLDGFDVATAPADYKACESQEALLASFDAGVSALREALVSLDDTRANESWRLKFGEREIVTWSRAGMIRTMGLNHWYHHRGELVVYLRLLEVAVPVVYGRSADENPFARPAA
jgi:uncharacterized damage-inducible protein DinB